MAIIRQVSKNTATGMYCFIELSDDVEPTFTILGEQYFATKEEAVERLKAAKGHIRKAIV